MGKEVLQVSEIKELKKVELEYEERDGIFYPKIYTSPIKYADIGKFGHMWMEFMESAFPIRYRNLLICKELYSRLPDIPEWLDVLMSDGSMARYEFKEVRK